ncbi:MAG: AMP-binding protein, partial [Cyanobacteria bacterium]|nr:AMP-binding protein [Cyanobacteriota bacterium]
MMIFNEKRLLHRRFAEVAARLPDNLAIITEDGLFSLTYRELDERSAVLAKALVKSAGNLLSENNYIGIMVHRNIGMIVALLAILKAGAAYIPVDPSFPEDRQAYIFSHSKCPLLIVDEDTYSAAQTLASAAERGAVLPAMFIIEKDTGFPQNKALLGGGIREVILSESHDERPVSYVLYTSGSTGKPKGVMVYQDSVINIIDWFGEDIGMDLD